MKFIIKSTKCLVDHLKSPKPRSTLMETIYPLMFFSGNSENISFFALYRNVIYATCEAQSRFQRCNAIFQGTSA